MTVVPNGWAISSLAIICERISDGSHNPPPKQVAGFPMLSAINVANNTIKFDTYRLISSEDFEQEDRRTQIAAGDVLLTIVGAIGRAAVVPKHLQKFTLQRSVAVLRSDLMIPKFMMYHLEEPQTHKYFIKNARGTAQKGVYLKTLGATPVLLPPLNEQHRIVEKIEALFDEIDKGVESLKAAKAALGLYRQSLLKAAFEGRLTAEWRVQNPDKLEDPQTLLARIRKEREARYKSDLAAWQEATKVWLTSGRNGQKPTKPKSPDPIGDSSLITLNHLVMSVSQGWSPKCENQPSPNDDTWGVIKTTAIQSGYFLPEENKALPNELSPREWLEVQNGDVLITRAGPRTRVGIACMVKNTRPKLMLCDKAYRIDYLKTLILPEFLEAYLNAPDTQRKIEVIKSGISDSGLNLKQDQFLELEISLPTLSEQEEIINRLNAKLESADRVIEEIDGSLARAEALRQSVLKRAFAGQLVSQDPTDEPASVLLERIQKEKASAAPKGKRKAFA